MADEGAPPDDTSPSLAERIGEGRRTFQPALWAWLIAIGVVAIYLLLFVVLNTRRVRIDFVVSSTRVSLIWAILLNLAAGIVLGVLLSQFHRYRRRRDSKQ